MKNDMIIYNDLLWLWFKLRKAGYRVYLKNKYSLVCQDILPFSVLSYD